MLVAQGLDRHAARHCTGHPIVRHPSAGQFGDADRHALAADAVRQAATVAAIASASAWV